MAERKRPPLDHGFFKTASRLNYSEFASVRRYLQTTYDIDPTDAVHDSLEGAMAMIYADIHNPQLADNALTAFRSLIRLFNRRVADSTNTSPPTNRSNLYRILCQMLDNNVSPDEICIVTLNQDLHIEKVLMKIQETNRPNRSGRVFNFPFCYGMDDAHTRLTRPQGDNVFQFNPGDPNGSGIRVLKLHGSLNWYSIHNTRDVTKNAILNARRRFRITTRQNIAPDMTVTRARTEYTFPLIIPPVTHKAGILHERIQPLWDKAESALRVAKKIVVFGYSCPATDFESANLLRRTIRQNKNLREFHVIDPNAAVFQRYVDLTRVDGMHYFKSASRYLKHAAFHMT